MQAKDAIICSLAECFITIGSTRYNFMQLINFESHLKPNATKVDILGRTTKGNKMNGGEGTWSGTAHYNQSILRILAYKYQSTGLMSTFDIQVTNEDPTSSVGRQTIILKGCLIDDFTLAKFGADYELLDEDLSGTFDSFEMPEKFKVLSGMR